MSNPHARAALVRRHDRTGQDVTLAEWHSPETVEASAISGLSCGDASQA